MDLRLKSPQLADPALELATHAGISPQRAESTTPLPRALVDQAFSQLNAQLHGRYGPEDIQRIAYAAAQHSHTEAHKGPPQNFLVHKNGDTLAIQYPHQISELNLKELARAPSPARSNSFEQDKQALLGHLFPGRSNSLSGLPVPAPKPLKGNESASVAKATDFRTASINQCKLDDHAAEHTKRDGDRLSIEMKGSASVGQMRAMTATEGFLTFNPVGRFLKGWGESATEILKSPYTVPKEALLTAKDATGNVVYSALNRAFDGKEIYRNESALFQSIDAHGVLGTLGRGVTGTVKSLPVIAQIDAIHRRDAYALGASVPGTALAAGATATLLKPSTLVASPAPSRVSMTTAEQAKPARGLAQAEAGHASPPTLEVTETPKTIPLVPPDLSRSNAKLVQKEEALADLQSVVAKPAHADAALRVDAPSPMPQQKMPSIDPRASAVEVLSRSGVPMQINGLPLALSLDTPVYRVQPPGLPLEPHISEFLNPSEYGLSLRQPWDALYISTDRAALHALRTRQGGYFDAGAQMFTTTLGQLMEKSGPGTTVFSDTKMNITLLGAETGNYVLLRPRFSDQTLLDNPRIEHLAPKSAYEFAISLAREADKGRSPAAGSIGAALLQDIRQTTATVGKYKKDEFGNRLLNEDELNEALQQVIERHRSALKKPLPSQPHEPLGADVLPSKTPTSLYSLGLKSNANAAFRSNDVASQLLSFGQERALDYEKIQVSDWLQPTRRADYAYLKSAEEHALRNDLQKNRIELIKTATLNELQGRFSLGDYLESPAVKISDSSVMRGVVIHEVGHANHYLSDARDFVQKYNRLSENHYEYLYSISAGTPIDRRLLAAEMGIRAEMEAVAVGNVLNNAHLLRMGDYDIGDRIYFDNILKAHQLLASHHDLHFMQKKNIFMNSSLRFAFDQMVDEGKLDLNQNGFIRKFIQ